ncbi:hypothetical protein COMA2_30336 [Candidatus Nitrospira nitrificans]|uniref:Uncharacterized protein n=1 Tax=Candidatus Nitrospira nitrificans TaxID=1742973 RepID=A0A0S4LLD3_9BACT|nr:hypothetical protein COMA2_30336 [Candidatus Nitrospira nitrificans]
MEVSPRVLSVCLFGKPKFFPGTGEVTRVLSVCTVMHCIDLTVVQFVATSAQWGQAETARP